MLQKINISLQKRLICLVLSVGIAAIAFAGESLGGGGGDKPKVSLISNFALSPFKANTGFTLKAGPSYRGSSLFNEPKTADFLMVNSVITYQKGNTTYILPYKHKVSITAAKSNLQAVNVTIRR